MGSNQALILCVDDEPVNLTIMEELLQDNYALATAKSGEECLQQVAAEKPDLILLDVNMPDLDGLETCQRLKEDPETADIPIVFVSALASHAELMAGYEAGGDDYVTKPFSEEILVKKIDVVLASQQRKQELKRISDDAVQALEESLSATEQLVEVVRFLHQSRAAGSIDELVRRAFDCLRKMELDGSMLVVDGDENRIWFSDDIDRPMERQILESLRGQDRVVSFGTRLAFNSDHATLLVRNLPRDDEGIARSRALLAILTESMESRMREMESDSRLDDRRQMLAKMLAATREGIARIDAEHQDRKARTHEILATLGDEIKRSLLEMDLPKTRQTALLKIIEHSRRQAESVYENGVGIDDDFQAIVDELARSLDD